MGLNKLFAKEDKKVLRYGVSHDYATMSDYHNYIKPNVGYIYTEVTDLNEIHNGLYDFLLRYGGNYRIILTFPKITPWDFDTSGWSFVEFYNEIIKLGLFEKVYGFHFTLDKISDEFNIIFQGLNLFLERMVPMVTRAKKKLYFSTGNDITNYGSFSLDNLLSLKRSFTGVSIGVDSSCIIGEGKTIFDLFKKERALYGFARNIDLLFLGKTEGSNVENDIYLFKAYELFIKEFKNDVPIIFTGDIHYCNNLIKQFKDGFTS